MAIVNVTPPVISGTMRSGQTLSTTDGTWTSDDPLHFAYKWYRCDAAGTNCTQINNAAHSVYTLTPSDIGSTIKVGVTPSEVPVPPPPDAGSVRFALGTDADEVKSATVGRSLGVTLMRSFDSHPSDSVGTIQTTVNAFQSKGIQPYILCNWGNSEDVEAITPGNIPQWAATFGPGGTHYIANPSLADLAVPCIEMGNEWFYGYRGGPTDARCRAYARAFKDTSIAVHAANSNMLMGFMADVDNRGTSAFQAMVDSWYAGVSNIHDYIDVVFFHTYGPPSHSNVFPKMETILDRMEAHGAPDTIPIWISEDGIASDNGASLSPNNYGWPVNMTYNAAGQGLRDKFTALRNHSRIGPRLAVWTNYQAWDQRTSGTGQREHYFGAVKQDGTGAKGDMTQSVRDHAAAY